jgi:uncharacterized protein
VARAAQLPRPRHVPQRTCVACRQGKAKRELVRVVRTTSGAVRVDPTGKQSGRGAYLCQSPDCWSSALHRGVLPRALKLETLPEDDLLTLTEYAGRLAP